uniref:Putative n-acetylglucosaminyltransferase complex n=1 Tax=Ixodes ricinus TaxID=34613 RepID=V5GYT5_IXORI
MNEPADESLPTPKAQTWRKVLYEDQNVPDNYVDQSFLCQLRKNVNPVQFTVLQALYAATGVTQQICRAVLFVVLYAWLKEGSLSPITLLASVVLLCCPAYLLYVVVEQRHIGRSPNLCFKEVLADLRRAAIFVAFGFSLAPILKTLTETISTDTVYAMAAGMLLLHLVTHDYSEDAKSEQNNSEDLSPDDGSNAWSTVSLNGALFAAVCLASRLPGIGPVFALSTLAVALFLLAPLLCSWIQGRWHRVQVALTVGHVGVALAGCGHPVLLVVLACVGLLLPCHFVHCHRLRQNIHGPWDEAVIEDR